jgi:putative NADH-flavin reductase
MKVLIFGASGKTGGLVVDRALTKGHEVSVLVRDPSKFKMKGAQVLTGDATNAEDVLRAMGGQDAVIDTMGGTTPYRATKLESSSVRNIIDAMRAEGARRLIVVSMMGLGESRVQAPFWYKYLLMTTFLRGSTPDKGLMEESVRASGLEYVIARPAILKDGPATGHLKVLDKDAIGHSTTRADLAAFLVDQLEVDDYLGSAVTLVND